MSNIRLQSADIIVPHRKFRFKLVSPTDAVFHNAVHFRISSIERKVCLLDSVTTVPQETTGRDQWAKDVNDPALFSFSMTETHTDTKPFVHYNKIIRV